jgi:hypothetical protein
MSCGCNNEPYNNVCRQDIPYPQVSHESVPSLIDNLVQALYGDITKSVVSGRVVWNIPCDPNNSTQVFGIPRLPGEGLLCYLIRCFDDFNEKYLGSLASAPLGPQQEGALYWNSINNEMFVWNGTAWQTIIPTQFTQFTPFLSTGTPTARNLVTRGADIINVKDFGAVGDGVANDAPAIRAAFNFAVTKLDSTVYFPQGKYALKTFFDGSSTWVSQTYSVRPLIGPNDYSGYDTGTTVRKLKVLGDRATLTSGLFPNNQLSYFWQDPAVVPSNPNNYGPSILSWFSFTGNWQLEFDGLELISTFGGAGERTPRNAPANEYLYTGYGAIDAITVTGSILFPSADVYTTKANCKITNCKFVDFTHAVVPWLQTQFIFDNNNISVTYGYASTGHGGFPYVGINGNDTAAESIVTNNTYDGCATKDITFLNSSTYSPTLTLPLPAGGTGPIAFNVVRGGQDGFWHCGYGYRKSKEIVSKNTISGWIFEAIKNQGQTNNYAFTSKTSSTSGDPASGYISWNNATQTSATALNVSYISSSNPSVSFSGNAEYWFRQTLKQNAIVNVVTQGKIQYTQRWKISGTPTFFSTYVQIPVTLIEAKDRGVSCPQGTVIEFYNESVADLLQVIWTDNNIDGTVPIGGWIRQTYGMTPNCSNAIVTGNIIRNSVYAIQPNQQGCIGYGTNYLFSDNISIKTAYPNTGYWNSPRTSYVGEHIALFNCSNATIAGNRLITIDPYDPTQDGYPSDSSNGNIAIGLSYCGLGGITIENNQLVIENPKSGNGYAAVHIGSFNPIVKNNYIDGFKFITVFGGAGNNPNSATGQTLLSDNIFTGTELFKSENGQGYPAYIKDMLFTIYPTQSGWYKLYSANDSWVGGIGIVIKTPSRQPTGVVNTWQGQKTSLELAWQGNPYVDDWNIATINQISHNQNVTGMPITKCAIRPFENYGGGGAAISFYVSQALDTYPIFIYDRAGGGSGASARAVFTNGVITSITGLTGGTGYTSDTRCIISPWLTDYITYAETNGSGAILTPVISGGIIQSITITNGGSGYAYPIQILVKEEMAMTLSVNAESDLRFSAQKIIPVTGVGGDVIPTESNSCMITLAKGTKCVTKSNAMQAAGTKTGVGTIAIASGVPSSTPDFIGQEQLDTATNKFYKAKGTASSADWIALN